MKKDNLSMNSRRRRTFFRILLGSVLLCASHWLTIGAQEKLSETITRLAVRNSQSALRNVTSSGIAHASTSASVSSPAAKIAVAAPLSTTADCSATNLIADHINWLKRGRNKQVLVTAVSNQQNRLVSYAAGYLKLSAEPFPGEPQQDALGGTLKQYFSDRKFALPPKDPSIAVNQHPFSPTMTEQLGLSLSSAGSIMLTLRSWGNTNINLTGVRCAGGVLYGLTDTTTPSFYVISLTKETVTPK
jgi:hypothetical protein